jgi:ferric hydroxamate transport system ATP-binding protein
MSVPATSLRGVDLTLAYDGAPVVRGADLALSAGRVTALVGPNGSGKSTLLRALARLHRPQRGDVRLPDGDSAATLSAKSFAQHVTMLAQTRPTPSGVCVRDVVGYGRHPYRGRLRANDPEGPVAVAHAMEVTGVAEMADRGVDELSGGERQRVWLATALAQDTSVLLLDEPTNHLDLRYQIEILDLVRDLADDHGVAVGVVLHDLDHAAAVADRVALLAEGRVQQCGTPQEVFTADALSTAYGVHVEVCADPHTGHLTARPIGRHNRRLTPLGG